MGIEQDINQPTFRNEKQKATVNLLYTHNWVMERVKAILEEEDLTTQQYNILRILRGSFPVPLSTLQIRERMLDKMSDTSRMVDRLVSKELVSKKMCAKDKRLVDVSITDKGRRLLDKLDQKNEEMDDIIGRLDETELQLLNKLLDKIRSSQTL